jgi:hypothetical protein
MFSGRQQRRSGQECLSCLSVEEEQTSFGVFDLLLFGLESSRIVIAH